MHQVISQRFCLTFSVTWALLVAAESGLMLRYSGWTLLHCYTPLALFCVGIYFAYYPVTITVIALSITSACKNKMPLNKALLFSILPVLAASVLHFYSVHIEVNRHH